MAISTLTLALSVFTDKKIHAISVGKTNPDNYHIYYKKNGSVKVMSVPRSVDNFEKLQREVGILLSRTDEEQLRCGHKDAK